MPTPYIERQVERNIRRTGKVQPTTPKTKATEARGGGGGGGDKPSRRDRKPAPVPTPTRQTPQAATPAAQARFDTGEEQPTLLQRAAPPVIQAGRFLFGEGTGQGFFGTPPRRQTIEEQLGIEPLPPTAGGPSGVLGQAARNFMELDTLRSQEAAQRVNLIRENAGLEPLPEEQIQIGMNTAAGLGPGGKIGNQLGLEERIVSVRPGEARQITTPGGADAVVINYQGEEVEIPGRIANSSADIIDPFTGAHPDTMWHATTNLPALESSGHLIPGAGTGLGGVVVPRVSLTANQFVAETVASDQAVLAGIAQGQHGGDFVNYMRQVAANDAARAGLSAVETEQLIGLATNAARRAEMGLPGLSSEASLVWGYTRDYLGNRPLPNPVFVTEPGQMDAMVENYRNVNIEDIGVISVPTDRLDESGALLVTDIEPELAEVAHFGELDIRGGALGEALGGELPGAVLAVLTPKDFSGVLEGPARGVQEQRFAERGGQIAPTPSPGVTSQEGGFLRTPGGAFIPPDTPAGRATELRNAGQSPADIARAIFEEFGRNR